MLENLKVSNLAVVANAEVHFAPGLNIVTGETGSGKSVLIGALGLVLGERADHGSIRTGAKELSVEAVFSADGSKAVDSVLADAGLPPCEDGRLIVRRTVSTSGSGRVWINDSSATLATLRRLGEHLIDIHGPYDHQSLLSPDFQLAILDSYAHDEAERSAYAEAYSAWQSLLGEKADLESVANGSIEEEIDLLRYAVSEIDDAALTSEDGDALVARHSEAANAGEIANVGGAVVDGLTDGEGSVFDMMATVQQRLQELSRILPEAGEWRDEIAEHAVAVQELSRTISDRLSRVEADPGLLEELEARLALVQRLKRKYGPTLEDVLKTRDARKERLDALLSREGRLAALDAEIAKALSVVRDKGSKLTKARSSAASRLGKAITAELSPLGFAQSLFSVGVAPCEPTRTGCDTVSFAFAPNPGEGTMPLRAIASSGEIARVMLAVKSVLAEHDMIPLLVFDEIDSNVGGEVGRAVGLKLRALSKSHQIISITHLPQVAAYGDSHFAVAKSVENDRTTATIMPLSGEARAKEIARMLGGSDLTSVTLRHAREMLKNCADA